jgi:hypothetical protein
MARGIKVVVDGVPHSGKGRRSQPQCSGPVNHTETRITLLLLRTPLAGTIGRMVIDHQQIAPGQHPADLID